VVTFSNGVGASVMKLCKTETAYIKATEGVIATSEDDDLDVIVSPDLKNKLMWVTQPQSPVTAGTVWPAFAIEIVDLYGNRTPDTDQVTITPSSGLLGGTSPKAALDGLVTFDDVTCNTADTITITGSADGLGATPGSSPIVVEAGPAASFTVTSQHSGTETAGVPFSITLTAKDGAGNTATGYEGAHNIVWTWTAAKSPNGTTPTKPADGNQTFTAGIATIPGFTLNNSGETPTITADVNGVSGTSDAITVNDGALGHVKVESAAGGGGTEIDTHSMTADDTFMVYSAGYDAYGNYREDLSVSWSGSGVCMGNLSPTLGTFSTFAGVAAGMGTILADHASATDDETGIIVVTAGALHHIVIEDAAGGTGNEVNTASINTDETLTVHAIAYDTEENYREDVLVTWEWASGDFDNGDLTTTTGSNTTFSPGNPGSGVLRADDGDGHQDSTGTLTAIQLGADISIQKLVDKGQTKIDEEVIFTIIVTNDGPSDATNIEVMDQLPSGLLYVDHNSEGSYGPTTGIWDVGDLAEGGSATLHITATVGQRGQITNIATRTASSPQDPNLSNDSDDVSVRVGGGAMPWLFLLFGE